MISIALGERVVRLVVENLSGGIVIGISYTYFFVLGILGMMNLVEEKNVRLYMS